MDIKNRKTALDDSSILYQKRDEASNKKDVKNLDKKGKLQYFKDYYLMKVLVVIVALIAGGFFINNTILHPQVTVLTVNCIGTPYFEDPEQLALDLRPVLEVTDKDQQIYISEYHLSDYNEQMALTTHYAAKELDILLLDKEQFERCSALGMCYNLSEVLEPSVYEEVKDQIVLGHTVTYDNNGEEESRSEDYPMAIDITGNPVLASYTSYPDELYLAFSYGSDRLDMAQAFLNYVLHPEASPVSE